MYNILICDDEQDIINALKIYLSDPNYTFYEANNGKEALEIIEQHEIHLVLMDIMMPVMNGITSLTELRKISNVPVIFLTAKSEDADMLLGLNIGADDYITKPFNPLEVTARVRSHLRRYMQLGGGKVNTDTYQIGGIELDDRAKTVTLDGEPVNLTPTEYEILKLLMQNPGKVFSPKALYQTIWNETPLGCENTLAVHIRHIREKIEITPAEPRYLKVVWGQGYKIES
ncbi:MAG: response regulator transcription factor [Oscillospiraceae bacterium]|nr:response regulator transcription factor [Oscillospiraceae bacterium]